MPVCGNCSSKGRRDCHYDFEGGERRAVVLREQVRQLKEENTRLKGIIEEQNRQQNVVHNLEGYTAATGPEQTTANTGIPSFSPTDSAPITTWTPVSADHEPPFLEYPIPPQHVDADGAVSLPEQQSQVWPMASVVMEEVEPSPEEEAANLILGHEPLRSRHFPNQPPP